MTYYEEKTGEPFVNTAIYPNRLKDKQDLENICDLIESGSDKFLFKTKEGSLIAQGYVRIVYGDHGSYIEFMKDQVAWENLECERKDAGYYNKWYTKIGRVLVYEQLKTVSNLPNPPAGKFSFNGNRKEGYADYRIGRAYVSPYEVVIKRV
jgi:hypothetical protein